MLSDHSIPGLPRRTRYFLLVRVRRTQTFSHSLVVLMQVILT